MSPSSLVVGLDVNTRNTGYAILNAKNGVALECGVVKTEDSTSVYDKVDLVRDTMLEARKRVEKANSTNGVEQPVWAIGVEDFMQGGRGGGVTAQTFFVLAKINSMISYSLYNSHGVQYVGLGAVRVSSVARLLPRAS